MSIKPCSTENCALDWYQYEPLLDPSNQIRLLRLPPKNRSSELLLQSFRCNLENAPAYKAMSYTWESGQIRRLFVDSKQLHVRVNCFRALQQASLHYANELIWIDSICINQEDNSEKNSQVGRMGEIYSRAELVLACVGDHEDNSQLLFECAPSEEQMKVLWEKRERSEGVWLWDPRIKADPPQENNLARLRQAVLAFESRSYWNRVWIMQELALAKEVLVFCGPQCLSWEQLYLVCCAVGEEQYPPLELGHLAKARSNETLERIAELRQFSRSSLIERLGRFRPCDCTDSRDRIFAMIALIDWDQYDRPPITPDYGKTPFEMALQAAPYLNLSNIDDLVEALRLHASDLNVEFIHESERCLASSCENCLIQHQGVSDTSKAILRFKIANVPSRIMQIGQNQAGTLQVTLSKLPSLQGGESKDLYLQPFLDMVQDEKFAGTKKLYNRTELVALASSKSRAGDYLVPWKEPSPPGISRGGLSFLVLRRGSGDKCDIIGQAFGGFSYHVCGGSRLGCKCPGGPKHNVYCAKTEVALTAEEALHLFLQDLDEDHLNEPERRVHRLITPVCKDFLGAAQVTEIVRKNRDPLPDDGTGTDLGFQKYPYAP